MAEKGGGGCCSQAAATPLICNALMLRSVWWYSVEQQQELAAADAGINFLSKLWHRSSCSQSADCHNRLWPHSITGSSPPKHMKAAGAQVYSQMDMHCARELTSTVLARLAAVHTVRSSSR